MQHKVSKKPRVLACERFKVYYMLMTSAGIMGAYTFMLRGGVFCNAQTANFVMMAVAFGNFNWKGGLYFLIPMTAYLCGSMLSEVLPGYVKKFGFLRWDTMLIGFEMLVLFLIGFLPLSLPHQIVQIMINFICSMQYNTFRQARNVPMATTFCTNHVRQLGIWLVKYFKHKDSQQVKRIKEHLKMIVAFTGGAIVCTMACNLVGEKAIWLAILPMMIDFVYMVKADLTVEKDMLDRVPLGH